MPGPTLKVLKEEVARLKEMSQAKADMVSISAHQIRSSLSAMKWIIKMFIDGDLGKMNPEQESLMKRAYDTNEKAITVLNELLLTNKTEMVGEKKYVFSKVDLLSLIDSAIFDFSGEAHAKGIEVIFLRPEGRTPAVNVDKEKISVALQNLVENALKYSDMHGKVFITVKDIDGMIQVSVKDTGVGISDEGRGKIFEKFYRDPEAQKKEALGSGIGLYTTKQIIEANGGKIWFESSTGEGTTFFFTVPIYKQ